MRRMLFAPVPGVVLVLGLAGAAGREAQSDPERAENTGDCA